MSQNHKKPVSRRDFIAAGLIPVAAHLFMPNWIKLLGIAPSAFAADACPAGGSGMIPFITIDLAGGGALQSNFVPHDQAGVPLSSYSKMGLGTNPTSGLVREFGNVPFAGNTSNGFLAGLKTAATAPTIAKTAFVGVCVGSQDDTANNPFDVSGLLVGSGLVGSQLPNMGTENTLTGGRHRSAVLAVPAPLIVKSVNDLKNSIGYAAAVSKNLNKAQQGSLAKLVTNLNATQTRKLAAMKDGSDVKNLLDCAGIKNNALVGGTGASLDPFADATNGTTLQGIWGTNPTNFPASTVVGPMIYNALNGNAGSATIQGGGYDYHGQARATTDQMDANAGIVVGRILETARVMNSPVFIYVTTDGAVGTDSTTSTSDWTGDRGTAGMAYMLFFDPRGTNRPTTTGYQGAPAFQIGNYTGDQVADPKSIVGSSPDVAAAAVFANYLAANKKVDQFSAVAGRIISLTDIDKVLRFG